MHRDMSEINIILKEIKNSPSAGIREFHVKRDSNRIIFISEIKYLTEIGCDHSFQIHLMRFFQHDLAEINIVFNDQYYLISAQNIIAVIAHIVNDLIQYIEVVTYLDRWYRL